MTSLYPGDFRTDPFWTLFGRTAVRLLPVWSEEFDLYLSDDNGYVMFAAVGGGSLYIKSMVILMKTIILFGLKRSGNHFLISTILQNYSNYVHMNNTFLSYTNYIKYKNIKKDKERIDNNWIGFEGVECVVISMENKIIDFNELDKFNQVNNCHSLILLRCPYDHFSSVWEVYNKNIGTTKEMIRLWKIYAELFKTDNRLIKVLYDEYSSNNKYLIHILNKIGIEIKDLDKNTCVQWGTSSYDNKNESKRIFGTLKTCVYKDNPIFIKLLEDKEIYNLWILILESAF